MSTPDTTTEAFADTRPASADDLPDYAPIPRSAFGPALNEQGYYVGRVERNLYWVTDGTYQSAFLTTVRRRRPARRAAHHRSQHPARRGRDRRRQRRQQQGDPPHLLTPPRRPRRRVLAVRRRRRPHRARGDAQAPAARRRPGAAGARRDLPGPPHPRDRRRAHRAGLARLQPLAGQHLHPPARPRHADARRHRQPGLGAGLPEQPHRGRARLHRRRRPPRSPTRGSTSSAATWAGSAPATTSPCTSSTWPTSPPASRTALDTVDPTPYFVKYGENTWAAVRGYLDAVTAAAAAPVIEKYTGVLAAADVFTASTTFHVMQSIRLDLGYGSQVHP